MNNPITIEEIKTYDDIHRELKAERQGGSLRRLRVVRLASIRESNRSPWPTGWRVGVRECPCCQWPLSYNDWEWGREWSCPQCGFEDSEPNAPAHRPEAEQ